MEAISSWIDENNGGIPSKKTISYRFFAVCLIIASAWMFTLGVSIGRNTCPVRFDNEPFMAQLSEWIESDIEKQKEYAKAVNNQEKKPEVDFFHALKKSKVDFIPNSEKQQEQAQLSEVKEKKLSTKRSTKKRTIGNFATLSETNDSDCVTLQAAALKNPHAAVEMASRLKKMGFPAYTASIDIPKKGLWHRVRIGTFRTVQQAKQMKNRLQKNNINAIIVPFTRGDDFNFANAKERVAYPES